MVLDPGVWRLARVDPMRPHFELLIAWVEPQGCSLNVAAPLGQGSLRVISVNEVIVLAQEVEYDYLAASVHIFVIFKNLQIWQHTDVSSQILITICS